MKRCFDTVRINRGHSQYLDIFRDKTVVITGHTGFKGSWLTAWLVELGANVIGISLNPPSDPFHFQFLNLSKVVKDLQVDIRNFEEVQRVITKSQPDFVFHLAAQSLVSRSLDYPLDNWQTNVIGTLNVLESLRQLNNSCVAVIITSDKCYKNREQDAGYMEDDELGGLDPYSASKASAEIAIHSYVKSFFNSGNGLVRIATARAGNVIGGGDWASDRIVPDCVKSWSQGYAVNLRNPNAIRPWQHVMEPLSGYLALAVSLKNNSHLHGESFNFGPSNIEEHTVAEIVQEMSIHWEKVSWNTVNNSKKFHESNLLKLNCEKASNMLHWHSVLNFSEMIRITTEWYKTFYSNPNGILDLTNKQISNFSKLAKTRGLKWAQ